MSTPVCCEKPMNRGHKQWHCFQCGTEIDPEESIVAITLKEIAAAIKSLEGKPVEFRIARKLSELLKEIGD